MFAYMALAGLQAAGGFQEADIIRQNGDLQASIQQMNSKYADLDAYNALSAGYANSAKYEGAVDRANSKVRGAYASEGVAVGYGTAGDVEKDNRIAGMVNSLQIQRTARDQAMGYQTQAINFKLGSDMTQIQGGLNASLSSLSGITKGAGSLISGYTFDQSTGKGKDSNTGTNDQSWNAPTHEVQMTSDGKGMAPPQKLYQPEVGDSSAYSSKNYDNGYTKWSDDFFGRQPRGQYNSALGGSYSFTSETGG